MASDVHINWNGLIAEYQGLAYGTAGDWFARKARQYFPDKSGKAFKSLFHRQRSKLQGKLKESPKRVDPRKEEVALLVIEMKERGKRRSDKPREMPTELCLQRLVERGAIEEGFVSASHINRLLRDVGYREETPRHRWEVPYALYEVQTDGSISKYYRPWKPVGADDYLLKASGRPLRYKEREHSKLVLWQFQDKYSRLRTVRGYPGNAESTGIMLAHFNFWLNRREDGHLMRHLPWRMGHDNGSVFKTQEWTHLMEAFEINSQEDRSGTPYEKTGTGSVERGWPQVWTFELALSEDYKTIRLSDYNMLLHQMCIGEQEKAHPVLKGYRGDLYHKSLLQQDVRPRLLDMDVRILAAKRYERKVTTELNVSIDGTKYRVPQYLGEQATIGQWVQVWQNWRGDLVGSLRDGAGYDRFALEPFEYRMMGDFSGSHKQTTQQRMKDVIDGGESNYQEVMAGSKKLMPTEKLTPEGPFTGSRKDAEAQSEEVFDSPYAAKVWVGKQLQGFGVTYGDVAGYFDAILEEGLGKQAIGQAVDELTSEIQKQVKTG